MGSPNRLHWLKRAAATSMVLVGGTTATLSPQVLDALLEAAERIAQEDGDCVRVLRELAKDARPSVRALVAEAVGALSPEGAPNAAQLLRDLAADPSSQVQAAVARGLARRIERSSPAERIELVCEWALSRDRCERATIARALASPTPVFVTDLVIQQLAEDEDPEIRALALRAAVTHLAHAPATYRKLAIDRLSDPDMGVRSAAETLLEREI